MAILVSNEIMEALHRELKNADQSVQIISAFCKEKTIEQLNDLISSSVTDKKLMVRFRMDDILKGSTDIGAIEYCLANGWSIFFRFDLHVKTYVVDLKRGIVGSANATNSGLGLSNSPNLEMATLVNMELEDIRKIDNLYKSAIPVNQNLLDKMKKEISNKKSNDLSNESYAWSEEITSLFKPRVETLFSYELPDSDECVGYIPFLDADFGNNLNSFKNAFRWSTAYLWLLQTLEKHDGQSYFGELSSDLHNALVSDPKPYRKDVKVLLANLLSLAEKLDMKEIVVDRPNHSQRVRLAK